MLHIADHGLAIRCREQATLRLRAEAEGAGSAGGPQLCYEVDVSGKVHESGRLGAGSAVACGNVDGLKPEIQPHTLRITEDARYPAKSFCGGPRPPDPRHAPCPAAVLIAWPRACAVTFAVSEIVGAKALVERCTRIAPAAPASRKPPAKKRAAGSPPGAPSKRRQLSGPPGSMAPPPPRVAAALDTGNDEELATEVRDCVEDPSFGVFLQRVDTIWRTKIRREEG